MNLLAHPNVRVLVRFARGKFAFLPPDHWAGGTQKAGTANWQVMILEIANVAGRGVYRRASGAMIEMAGQLARGRPHRPLRTREEAIGNRGGWTNLTLLSRPRRMTDAH